METIARLAGGLAHDFNNILTAITGYSGVLVSSYDEQDPLRSDLEEIKKAAERATSLTRELLKFFRKEAQSPSEALDIKEHHPGPIHLLLNDLVMLGMTGKELAEHWASLNPQTKVLCMSGYSEGVVLHGNFGEGAIFIQNL